MYLKLMILAFYMRFPREEWNNALKYYRPVSKLAAINQIESQEIKIEKKYNDEEKENVVSQ